MHICEMRLRNFRNFEAARFEFKKGVNTLIGENGSGKTNALHALRLLLDDSLSRRAIALAETDFCRSLETWKGHWIVISVDFEDLDPSEGCQLLKHDAGHMDGSNAGTHTLYFRPRPEVRKHLFAMSNDGSTLEERRAYLDSLTIDEYEPALTGRGRADMLDDAQYAALVGDFESLRFPNPDLDDQAAFGVAMPPIHNEISCTFAPALRDVVSDLRGYRSNPLLALLRGTEATIQIEDAERIVKSVEDLNRDISSLTEIKAIAAAIQTMLHATVGHTYSPLVDIESGLPEQMDKLLQRLNMRVGDEADSDFRGDLSEQSLGGANLIYLALKLLEYETKLAGDRVAHFLLIEEPEAHIHTHIQKTLFEKQSSRRTQVIVSTHSTHISSAARISSVNVLARKKNHAEVYQPAAGLEKPAMDRVERYLDSVRSTLLFAKGVVLVEGSAELLLVPSMLKAVFGLSPDEIGISIISMDSAFFEHIAVVFGDERIRRRCAIITDSDKAFIDLPEDPKSDNEEQKHARAAQLAGESRIAALSTTHGDNPWVEPFFANHTFEVDLVAAGNEYEVCEVINGVYTQPAAITRAQDRVKDPDASVYGTEMLRLAGKFGKGWLALLLGEKLRLNTHVPDYILRAIAFAAQDSLTPDVLKRIALFRVRSEEFDADAKKRLPAADDLEAMEPRDALREFAAVAQKDDLTKLMTLLGKV